MSTDNVRWSKEPDTWDIADLMKVALVLAVVSIGELFGLLYIGFVYLGFTAENLTIHTFTFTMLFYAAMFLLLNVRERGHFWNSVPSKALMAATVGDVIVGVLVATFGIADLAPIPLYVSFIVIIYSAVFSLFVNDAVKFILVKKTKLKW